MNSDKPRKLKTVPDIGLAGLKVWIHKYEFPQLFDYHDGNWLIATACCISRESEFWIKGAFLLTTDLEDWIKLLMDFNFESEDLLELVSQDNQLMLDFYSKGNDKLRIKVEITPSGNQQHFYYYDVDKDAINIFIEDMKKALIKFPVKGR